MRRRLPLLALVVSLGLAGCGRPPQIGPDRDTFKTVDALYTAISMRDPKLVEQCETQLNDLKTAGKIPDSASASLTEIIAESRAGKWESSQDHLHDFMSGQRR